MNPDLVFRPYNHFLFKKIFPPWNLVFLPYLWPLHLGILTLVFLYLLNIFLSILHSPVLWPRVNLYGCHPDHCHHCQKGFLVNSTYFSTQSSLYQKNACSKKQIQSHGSLVLFFTCSIASRQLCVCTDPLLIWPSRIGSLISNAFSAPPASWHLSLHCSVLSSPVYTHKSPTDKSMQSRMTLPEVSKWFPTHNRPGNPHINKCTCSFTLAMGRVPQPVSHRTLSPAWRPAVIGPSQQVSTQPAMCYSD